MSADTNDYLNFTLAAASHAAAVANYCDHVEHNEVVARGWVTGAGDGLRTLALAFAPVAGVDVFSLYADRLRMIESKNVLASLDSFDGGAAADNAVTWRELQLVQAEHDRVYHPDVVGLAKVEQLRHYALHLTKIVGAFATCASGFGDAEEISVRRLPDTLLFAIKLHTVMGAPLPEEPLPREGAAGRTSVTLSSHQT
jgi:hypothetical protein